MRADPAHEALRDHADDVAGHEVGKHAQIHEARNGADGGVGVQRRVDLVSGHRRAEGHLGRLLVANLAHQDDVRVLPHHRADAGGEVELHHFVHRGLPDHRHRVFDRILEGHDVDALGVHEVEHRIEGGRLAAARRAGDEDDALRAREHELEGLQFIRLQAQFLQRHDALVAVEDAQHDVLAVRRGLGGNAEVHRVA